MKINGFGAATEDECERFEKETGFNMPLDYRNFIKEYNGGIPLENDNFIMLEGTDESIMLDVLFGIGDKIEEDFNIITWIEEFKGQIPNTVIPIGSEVGGGIILLSVSQKRKGVFFWDFEFGLAGSNEWNCLYKIADTFAEFIVRE